MLVITQPPDPDSFYRLVWEIVRQVPPGRVSTYGQIASMIPPLPEVDPRSQERLAPRWVGQAMNACPPDVPWQRVINSRGMISLPRGSAAHDEQRALLESEGVEFDPEGRVNLSRRGWDGPPEEWLAGHGLLPPRPIRRPGADDETQMSLF
ncbi:MAG: hypothetical protein Kow00124_06620 [Anaerolineae bacterium]